MPNIKLTHHELVKIISNLKSPEDFAIITPGLRIRKLYKCYAYEYYKPVDSSSDVVDIVHVVLQQTNF